MSENREEILADFQACTGIENVEDAINYLNETNWDLLRAVSKVMPPDSQSFQPPSSNPEPDVMIVEDQVASGSRPGTIKIDAEVATDMMEVGNNVGYPPAKRPTRNHVQLDHSFPSTSASSSSTVKQLKFKITYCGKTTTITLPETANLVDLKMQIHREFKVAPCRQMLSAWARMPQYEKTPFSKLMLPEENSLQLTLAQGDKSGVTADNDVEMTERLNGTYLLNIEFEGNTYNLKYDGTKTILDVKTGFYTVTDVPVRNQIWSGWPPNIDEQTMLALTGISYPEHNLTVRRNTQVNLREKKNSQIVQIDSDDDEYEDASESFNVDEDYFVDNVPSKRTEPLIPENIEDETIASITFSEQFTARYGPIHPAFFQGTLEDAVREACSKPAKDRKILAIYLHHDSSVLTNVFCTQLLGFESVMQMFENNFVLWGWDITFESNRSKLLASVTNALGPTAAVSLRNIPIDRLPAIVLIMKIRSSTDIFSVVHGNVGVNELLSSLIEAVELFTDHQRVEIKEEQERAERELVKWEQDQAYRESLEADRAKEEAKRQQARAETEARQRLESEKAEEEAKKEAYRKEVEANLPPEPIQLQGENITKIRFRLPNGENIERRFFCSTTLKVLLDFLVVKGYPSSEYKVISSWPRRDLTNLDINLTLKELKLCPQETVILEER